MNKIRQEIFSRKTAIKFVAVLAIVGCGILTWREVVRPRMVPKRFGVVEKGAVYRSGQISKYLIGDVLDRHGMDVIIALNGPDPNNPDKLAEEKAAAERGIEFYRFPMRGNGTGDLSVVAEAVTVLTRAVEQGKQVLVHCSAGAQRTGHVLSAYQLLVRGENPHEVFERMQDFGWDPDDDHEWPNMLNQHMALLASVLQERRVIERVPQELPRFGPA